MSRPAFSMAAGAAAKPFGIAASAAVDGLLLLQEAADAPSRDRQARQHGRALLDALARLQLALLGGDPGEQAVRVLADPAGTCPEACDPALRDVLGAIALRAEVELARLEV